jgi:hypothetical protein
MEDLDLQVQLVLQVTQDHQDPLVPPEETLDRPVQQEVLDPRDQLATLVQQETREIRV